MFHAPQRAGADPRFLAAAAIRHSSASLVGGFLFRLGIGALPFLLPLMLQTGFGMTPFQSGLVTFAGAVGAIGMKTRGRRASSRASASARVLIGERDHQRDLHRRLRAFHAGDAGLGADRRILLIGGFFRSLQFTAINTIAYADIDPRAHEPRHRAGQRSASNCRSRPASRSAR